MDTKLKIALIQMDCVLGNKEANLSHAMELGQTAADKGANLIVFPEMFNTGYELSVLGPDLPSLSETSANCPTVRQLQEFAVKNKVSVCGTIPYFHMQAPEQGKPNISCFYIDSAGKILCIYDKNHMFGEEKEHFVPGETYPVIDTEFGRIGIMICYDANFPEPARILVCQGAEIILCPAAWRIQDIRLFDRIMPQRAIDNVAYICAVNRFGTDNHRYNPGHSQICDPNGELLAFGSASETILYGDIDVEEVRQARKEIPYLEDLREEEYPCFLKKSPS